MNGTAHTYFHLSSREGFNSNVRHIKSTLAILDSCENAVNVADEINQLLITHEFSASQISSAAYMLLMEKWGYSVLSRNLAEAPLHPDAIVAEMAKWKAVDIVLVYHHPDLGDVVINPRNSAHKELIADFRKNELVVVYAGFLGKKPDMPLSAAVCEKCLDLLENKKVTAPASFLKGSFAAPKEEKKTAPVAKKHNPVAAAAKKASGKPAASSSFSFTKDASGVSSAGVPAETSSAAGSLRKMTPLFSVPVTNELFHNGNVEAWKRIIDSYTAKHPNLQIFIYYDGERIIDINTLFKWGKVKHGSSIHFAVAGENPQDVAKLKRYFCQGASSQFEAFLHGAPGTIMKLF